MNKNILVLSSTYPRWISDSTPRFVHDLCKDLAGYGWHVHVLAPHSEHALKYEKMDGITIHRYQYFWPTSAQTLCYKGGALANLRKSFLKSLQIPFLLVFQFFAAWQLIRKYKFQIIHSHWLIPQGFIGSLLSWMYSIPHICTIHGSDVFALNSPVIRFFKRYVIKFSNAITVNSSATYAAAQQIETNIKTILTIPMGIQVGKQKNSSGLSRKDRYQLIFVGRLVEEKGLRFLLIALGKLCSSGLDIHLNILGDGPDRNELLKLCEDLNISEHCHWAGWIQPEHIQEQIARADIFIGPSISHKNGAQEAQGIVFLEAMSAGTPVIASNIGGIPDIVIHEKTGLLVSERSADEIKSAVIRLINDTGLSKHLVDMGYQHVKDNFSREASANKFHDLYESFFKA